MDQNIAFRSLNLMIWVQSIGWIFKVRIVLFLIVEGKKAHADF